MKTIDLRNNMPGSFTLYLWGDTHIGNNATSYTAINKFIKKVKSKKNTFVGCGGDQLETITVNDKRFALDVHERPGISSRMDDQRDDFKERFSVIADNFEWILDGNHELRYKNIFKVNKDIAKNFNCAYANGVLVKVLFPSFRLMDWHGYGSINSKAGDPKQRRTNNMISLKRKLRCLPGGDCEVMCSHHYHFLDIDTPNKELVMLTNPNTKRLVQEYTEPHKIWIDKKKEIYRIPEEDKYYLCCGSALRGYEEGYSTYIEEKGYRATEIGCAKIIVKNDKIKEIVPEYL